MPNFCTLCTSFSIGGIWCLLSGVGGGMGDMVMWMASDTPGVLPAWAVVNLPISLMMIIASAILRVSDLLWNWCGMLGEGDVG